MTAQARHPGLLRRMAASLTQTRAEQLAHEIQGQTREFGATAIDAAVAGEPITVAGVLRSVTLRPRETVPAVVAELYDGSGTMRVVWLGRRRIRGIEPGRVIVIHGRMTGGPDRWTMFNPRYELRPSGGGGS